MTEEERDAIRVLVHTFNSDKAANYHDAARKLMADLERLEAYNHALKEDLRRHDERCKPLVKSILFETSAESTGDSSQRFYRIVDAVKDYLA